MFIDSERFIWLSRRNELVRINMSSPSEKYIYPLGQKGLGKFMVTKITESSDGTLFLER